MNKDYTGTIIEQSLIDPSVLANLDVVNKEISGSWTLNKVKVSEQEIEQLANNIESNKWYMHFWKGKDVIAVFKDKQFRFNYDNKETWKPVVEYGLSIGIPFEQLDFPIE